MGFMHFHGYNPTIHRRHYKDQQISTHWPLWTPPPTTPAEPERLFTLNPAVKNSPPRDTAPSLSAKLVYHPTPRRTVSPQRASSLSVQASPFTPSSEHRRLASLTPLSGNAATFIPRQNAGLPKDPTLSDVAGRLATPTPKSRIRRKGHEADTDLTYNTLDPASMIPAADRWSHKADTPLEDTAHREHHHRNHTQNRSWESDDEDRAKLDRYPPLSPAIIRSNTG
ncbi:hypothetical protein MBLNU457_g0679t1 [Dothideomycetes sp. NU457]